MLTPFLSPYRRKILKGPFRSAEGRKKWEKNVAPRPTAATEGPERLRKRPVQWAGKQLPSNSSSIEKAGSK